MQDIYSNIGSLCLAIYIIGILFNLIKIKHTNKIMQTVLGLVLILNILSPFQKIDLDLIIETFAISEIEMDTQESIDFVIENASLVIKNDIENLFNEKNIAYKDVSVHIYKENENFFIKEISIYGSEDDEKSKIIELLKEIVNEECVIFRGEYE